MKKMFAVMSIVAMFSLTALAGAKKGTWTGWVSDEKCGAKVNADCAKKCIDGGQKMVFVNDKNHDVLAIANPDVLKGHEGHHIKVKGTVDNGALTVASASMMKSQTMKSDSMMSK